MEAGEAPQPREKVRIERLHAQPHPDGWRVKVDIDVTPFQERPSLEIRLLKPGENLLVAELSVIETIHRTMEFTIHIRRVKALPGDYVAEADLYYEDRANPQHRAAYPFTISSINQGERT